MTYYWLIQTVRNHCITFILISTKSSLLDEQQGVTVRPNEWCGFALSSLGICILPERLPIDAANRSSYSVTTQLCYLFSLLACFTCVTGVNEKNKVHCIHQNYFMWGKQKIFLMYLIYHLKWPNDYRQYLVI